MLWKVSMSAAVSMWTNLPAGWELTWMRLISGRLKTWWKHQCFEINWTAEFSGHFSDTRQAVWWHVMFLSCCLSTWPLWTSILSALGGNSSLYVTLEGLWGLENVSAGGHFSVWGELSLYCSSSKWLVRSVDGYTEDHPKALDTI